MERSPFIRDITGTKSAIRLSAEEKPQMAGLGIAVSDTETTGRPPQKLGLTEVASQRVVKDEATGTLRHEMFQAHILPWRPQIQDYFAAVKDAKEHQRKPPLYDRRKYEYSIDPRALAVTGAEFVREPKDGPITALKINGKRVRAFPFYEVMDDYLAFNGNGKKECFYNSQFDARVLADQIADVRGYRLAVQNMHRRAETWRDPRLRQAERLVVEALHERDYERLNDFERRELAETLRPLVDVPEAYTNPSKFHCLMLAYLAECGFSASNRLDDAHARVYPDASKRAEHKADEDVTMAAQVGLWLAREGNGKIPDVRELFERLLHKADPKARAQVLPPHVWHGHEVAGDLALQFSDAPEKLGPDAVKLWNFLVAFEKVLDAAPSGGIPRHLLRVDARHHRIDLNAERQPPLSLNFLKKLIFFSHLQQSTVIETIVPHHSTGTVMDVVLKPCGDRPARTVTDVHYASLRANREFIEAHPDKAADYLALIAAMRKADPRVGMVLLRERSNGTLDIILQGHVKAFGEVVIRLAPGTPIPSADDGLQAFADLQQCAEDQMRLGAIPHVAGLSVEEEEAENLGADDSDSVDEDQQLRRSKSPVDMVYDDKAALDEQMQLTVSEAIFNLMALRLHDTPEAMAARGYLTTTSGKRIHLVKQVTAKEKGQARDTVHYQLVCARDTFHEFVDLGEKPFADGDDTKAVGERPSNLIKDASWLLYRLEQIPGTYGLHLEGNMAVLEQRDGVDIEALGLLSRVGIPYKAYGTAIKVDASQLMKNAFHWSVALSREQKARKAEERLDPQKQSKAPPKFLQRVATALLRHPNCALEVNEARQYFLVDGSLDHNGQEVHHPLDPKIDEPVLTFHQGSLVPPRSDLKGIFQVQVQPQPDGSARLLADNAVMRDLIAHQLRENAIDLDCIEPSQQARVVRAAEDATRFMMGIAKSTRSQRLPIDRAEFSDDDVLLGLPQQQFIGQAQMFTQLLTQHQKMAEQTLDRLIRDLHKTLPDPVREDSRCSDPKDIADRIYAQRDVLMRALSQINQLQLVLGGEVKRGDSLHLNPPQLLQRELETLGTLLHELSSSGAAIDRDAFTAVRAHIDTAQGLLSSVAYGNGHMREHFSVAAKTILSGDRHCLWAKLGEGMAHQIEAYAAQAAYTYPEGDLAAAMQPFEDDLMQYFGVTEAAYQQYAYRAALRQLLQYHQQAQQATPGPEARAHEERVLNYLLAKAHPEMNRPQRDAVIALYREGQSAAAIDGVYQAFPPDKKGQAVEAERLLRQFELLSGAEPIHTTMDAWWESHREEAEKIDQTVRKAYVTRGKQYLTVARLNDQSALPGDRYEAALLRLEAVSCLRRAGWGAERIAQEKAKPLSRNLTEETKNHLRVRVALGPLPETASGTVQDLKSRVDMPGHETRLRRKLRENAYAAYESEVRELIASRDSPCMREAGSLLIDARDAHAPFKLSHILLDATEKLRKETQDVRLSKPHHLRDLQAAIALGDQDDRVQAAFNEHDQREVVGSILREVKATPEEVGLTAQTVSQVQRYSGALNEAMQGHASAYLEGLGLTPELLDRGVLSVPYTQLEAAFDRWRKVSKPQEKDLTYGLKKRRVDVQYCLKALPQVRDLDMRNPQVGVMCTVWLPEDEHERHQLWNEVVDAVWGMGVQAPPMPEGAGLHEVNFAYTPHLIRQTADATTRHLAKPFQSFVERLGLAKDQARTYARARLNESESSSVEDALHHAQEQLCKHYGEDEVTLRMQAVRKALSPLANQR